MKLNSLRAVTQLSWRVDMHPRVHSFRTPDGVTVGVEHFGDATAPLVLLAGGPTMLSWPDQLCEALAHGGRHVVRYDLRDAGASTTVDPESPRSPRSITRTPSRPSQSPDRGPSHRARSTPTCPTTTQRR
jgi:pimeloyl-ACP methyl ester carboxylesterase